MGEKVGISYFVFRFWYFVELFVKAAVLLSLLAYVASQPVRSMLATGERPPDSCFSHAMPCHDGFMMEIFRDCCQKHVALLDESASQEAGPHRTSLEAIWPSLEAIYAIYGLWRNQKEERGLQISLEL